jgi:hypothetical protein
MHPLPKLSCSFSVNNGSLSGGILFFLLLVAAPKENNSVTQAKQLQGTH